ncbi:MAG: hypothetical protein K1060chlam5_00733, partial [Candidatus Anoxychlamydiales bacterium]|nr:hypothetical protein [Candidatus Anoxychlamydiales bacterium]
IGLKGFVHSMGPDAIISPSFIYGREKIKNHKTKSFFEGSLNILNFYLSEHKNYDESMFITPLFNLKYGFAF